MTLLGCDGLRLACKHQTSHAVQQAVREDSRNPPEPERQGECRTLQALESCLRY